MRVVAGSARGRRLSAPPGTATRPTTDRTREAVFNVLFSLGGVDEARVLDLFAGSGALGIEALSRGARHATFVEADRRAAAVVRANLDSTGLAGRAHVHSVPVERFVADRATGGDCYDLVLADPPYEYDAWSALLVALEPALCDDAVVVVESDRPTDLPAGWEKVRERTYGGTVITFARVVVADRDPQE